MRDEQESSELVGKGPCPACGSSDACASYDDGHTHCFSCGKHSSSGGETQQHRRRTLTGDMIEGDFQPLLKRKITEETCRKFGYRVGKSRRGETVQIAEYRDDEGSVVAQHVRGADKEFSWAGDAKAAGLWGKHLWRDGGKRIVVTEGEIDAMSYCQALGGTWPVVSIPNGANGARKAVQRDLEFLESYDSVLLCFDNDEPGRAAAQECAALFTPGRCRLISLPLKDAGEMLVAGQVRELTAAMYEAKVYRPDGVVSASDIRDRVLATPEVGLPYWFDSVTEATYGRRLGQIIGIGAGVSVGKTDLILQMIEQDVNEHGLKAAVLLLEQDVGETGKRLAGKAAGKQFHIPGGDWTQDELVEAWDKIEQSDRIHFYDNWGGLSWEIVRTKIRYFAQSIGCQIIVLDHLTALLSKADDERRALDDIMEEMASMAKALNIIIVFVSHLSTPDGTPHEEGGRVQAKHFTGSRAIMRWAHMLWGLERNTQAESPEERRRATLRCLKDRYTGKANGRTWRLSYDEEKGRLIEAPEEESSEFRDETGGQPDF